eukprot:CAMPEP_0113688824 /NCGR_PEP_ID=MMETSP0038_2-20120614/16775_1 /TAXON_ID=2898 /ORGANISM="Cryptomonas paramecium" /LENGTH=215 /DNA_ID=CAMNT_0000609731 /DNA_START=79 /DNA_END=726 /DNA_ORIENTATION=- /assembly_acc=CAM_ASM_000170
MTKKGVFYELGVIFSKEKRDERAKALQEEVDKGRFYELNELQATGGKLFEGTEKLVDAKSARNFPKLEGVKLTGDKTTSSDVLRGKVSLVTISLRDIARPMIPSWTKPFSDKFSSNQHVQVVDIFFVEGAVYKMFQGMMVSSVKKRIPQEAWASTFLTFDSNKEIRKELDLTNRLVAYILLVDQEGRVRWKGVGYAHPNELKTLFESTSDLARLR